MQTLLRRKFFLKSSMTSKVSKGHKQWLFSLKIHCFFCLCYWLIEETNAAEFYVRTKFDLYTDDILSLSNDHQPIKLVEDKRCTLLKYEFSVYDKRVI